MTNYECASSCGGCGSSCGGGYSANKMNDTYHSQENAYSINNDDDEWKKYMMSGGI